MSRSQTRCSRCGELEDRVPTVAQAAQQIESKNTGHALTRLVLVRRFNFIASGYGRSQITVNGGGVTARHGFDAPRGRCHHSALVLHPPPSFLLPSITSVSLAHIRFILARPSVIKPYIDTWIFWFIHFNTVQHCLVTTCLKDGSTTIPTQKPGAATRNGH